MNTKQWFSDFARGASLGTGILPGVSVGTVGIIVNVYDKLLGAIDGLRKKKTFWNSLLALLPIAIGCILAVVLILLFWHKLAYPYFPFPTIAALAGFVIGALPIMINEIRGEKVSGIYLLRMGIGFVIAAGIGILAYLSAAKILPLDMNFAGPIDDPFHNAWIFLIVLIVGFFAAVSCLVPGISGSMVMFIFGLYNPIVNLFLSQRDAQGNIIHASIFHETSRLGGGLAIIGVLLVGMLIGFLATSKLMKGLLENHRKGTFTIIVGFVCGSVVSMFFNNDMYGVYHNPNLNVWWQYVIGALLFVVAMALTFFLVRKTATKNGKSENNATEA